MATYGLTIVAAAVASPQTVEAKPNFLIILSDDVGWAEYGFQGGKDIPTPNIDSIAQAGVRFPQGYVSGPYCSPTRAGLMTGRYQTRFGHEFNSVAQQTGLALTERTMADRLHDLGYATCAVGKWHLGRRPAYRPMARGFDDFYGTLANTAYFHPSQFVDSRVSPDVQAVTEDDYYTTDAFGDRVVEWLDEHQDQPWFVYLPFNAQHAPLQAPQKYVERFGHIKDENRRKFAAMMSAMDDAVGKVLAKIRSLGQEENTLIVFLSDNGGPTGQTTSSNLPLRGGKGTTFEGGVRVPFCMQWKGALPAGKTYDAPIIQLDLLPTAVTAAGGVVDPAWKLDGVDLLPYLTGQNAGKPHEALYWRFGDQWAIRHGDWKLVVGPPRTGRQPQLYNLVADASEAHNLATEQPEKVKELQSLWDKWNAEQAPPSAPKEQNRKPGKQANKLRGKGKAKANAGKQ